MCFIYYLKDDLLRRPMQMFPQRFLCLKHICIHPDHVLFAAEPGQLSFGKAARVSLDEPHCFVKVVLALEAAVDLLVAVKVTF